MNKLFLLLTIMLIFSCSKKKEQLFIAGSSTILPIVVNIVEDFILKDEEMASPIINSGGSGIGFSYVAKGKIDIGMMSRSITKKEKEEYLNKNFVVTSIAYDAVIPVVSSEIYDAGVKVLTSKQIRSIYNGEVDNWKEFGGPDRRITVYDKESSRGTRQVFMKALFGDANFKAKGADEIVGSNNEEQRAITQSSSAIGMLSLAWLNDDVRPLGIKVGKKVIIASKKTILNGTYPIKRSLDLITIGKPEGVAKRFIDFILSKEGQNKVEKLGYVSIQK